MRRGASWASALRPGWALLALTPVLLAALWWFVPWSVLGTAGPPVQPTPLADFTAAELARDTAFHQALRPWTYTRALVVLGFWVLVALTPAGRRVVVWCGARLGGSWPADTVAGTAALLSLASLVALPFSAGAEAVLRRYGLSTQGWASWLTDVARSYAVNAIITAALALMLVGLARRWPRGWWAPAAAAVAAAVLLGSLAYPLVIEPLANNFRPLAAGPQRSELLALAARDGQPVSDVLVADASRRTTAQNAYVSGLGATRRLVVFDTLLQKMPPNQVRQVVAHELGHVAEHDVLVGTGLGALAAVWAVIALAVLARSRWWRGRGVTLAGSRSLVLVLAMVAIGGYLAAPVATVVSRRVEARADVHALDLTRDPATFVAMQRQLAIANVSDLQPRWYRELLFESHPSPAWRVALARAWAQREGVPESARLAP